MCVCLSFHLLWWAHSLGRFLGPQLGLLFFEFEPKSTVKDNADQTHQQGGTKETHEQGAKNVMRGRGVQIKSTNKILSVTHVPYVHTEICIAVGPT